MKRRRGLRGLRPMRGLESPSIVKAILDSPVGASVMAGVLAGLHHYAEAVRDEQPGPDREPEGPEIP